jgi:hypothetical protein
MAWCPHWWTLRKDWQGDLDFEDVVIFMREHSYQERFGKKMMQYYRIGDLKYWTMGFPPDITKLINRAKFDTGHPNQAEINARHGFTD